MITKTARAIQLMREGNIAKALSIFKTFKMSFNKDEQRTIQIASETMNGMTNFYISLGYNVKQFQTKAIEIINKKYNL